MERGFPGLLPLGERRHWTVFVSDFAIPPRDVDRVKRQIASFPTHVLFARADRLSTTLDAAGVDAREDYVSLQVLVHRFESLRCVRKVFASLSRADLAQIDLPLAGTRFKRAFATHALNVVMAADYGEQDQISDRFFKKLESKVPYRVEVQTCDGTLIIRDDTPWFHLAGRMTPGELRALPGGEVAYTGDRIEGTFVADGALLPSPEDAKAGRAAARLHSLSRRLSRHPVRLVIEEGRIVKVEGDPSVSGPLQKLLRIDERYTQVTEIGISFNRACNRFIHQWPAASNEGRPGVHIGIGGDPDRRNAQVDRNAPLVHIDLMSASSAVWVNGTLFLTVI